MSFTNYLEDENDKPYFTKNSLAYYYDKMEGFAKAVEGSAKALNLTKEEVEKRITLYIEQNKNELDQRHAQNKNELDQRLAQWDGKLETFDSSVETLLTEWVEDGTLTHVIDGTLIDQKIAPVSAQIADKAKQADLVLIAKQATSNMKEINSNGYSFNILEGLKQWRSGISKPLRNVLVEGHSVAVGFNAPDVYTEGWAGLLKSKLQSIFGNTGYGFRMTNDPLWTFTGTWTTFTDYGPNGFCRTAIGNTNKATITVVGDNVDVYVNGYPSASAFTVQIDNETPVSFTPTTAQTVQKFNVVSATNGTHTVTITPGTTNLYLIGLSANIGETGVRLHNVAKSGGVINDLAYGRHKDFVDAFAPDLTIISYIINDFNAQLDLASFKTRMETMILKSKAYGDVLLISDGPILVANKAISQKEYEKALIQLAIKHNCGFISIYDRWVDYPNALALGFMGDNMHPNKAGHFDEFLAISSHIV